MFGKFPQPSYRYTINCVFDNYRKLAISENFKLVPTAERTLSTYLIYILYILNIFNTQVTKAAGTDKIPGEFLKDKDNLSLSLKVFLTRI